MDDQEKKERAKLIAVTIEMLLQQVDNFTNMMSKEDIEIMLESKQELEEKISYNQSAMALICALGGEYDSTEDEMKIKTLDCLIKLMQIRNEYKESMKEQQQKLIKRKEVLKAMGL